MERSATLHRNLITIGIPLGLLGLLLLMTQLAAYPPSKEFGLAISIDLLLTVPLIYFLLIRKTGIPNTTVVPIMIIGYLLGIYFLPASNHTFLDLFKTWAFPVIEGSVLIFIVLKVRKAIREYKRLDDELDFFDALKATCAEILPKPLVKPFATEVAVFYYGFVNWKTHKLNDREFSLHKKSGTPALFGALIFIIATETIVLHLLLGMWSETAAWIVTGLSIYSGIQIFGFARSLAKRPISLNKESLRLRYGILSEAKIPLRHIKSATLSREKLPDNDLSRTLSPLGELESHNLIIELTEEALLKGLYGSEKPFLVLGLHVDEPERFKSMVDEAANSPVE